MKYEYEYRNNKFRTYLKKKSIKKLFKTEERIYLYTDIYRNNMWNNISIKDQTQGEKKPLDIQVRTC